MVSRATFQLVNSILTLDQQARFYLVPHFEEEAPIQGSGFFFYLGKVDICLPHGRWRH